MQTNIRQLESRLVVVKFVTKNTRTNLTTEHKSAIIDSQITQGCNNDFRQSTGRY